jgi:tetratricopeptide (TPR) repeat protein
VADVAEIQERIDKCRKILENDPNSQIFAALAEAYRRKGELDKAFRVCQNGLKVHPSYGSAHVVMAKINLDRRQYQWAETEAKKAAELDGWTRSTELLLAEIYIYKGEFNPAIKLLKRLHQNDPENGQIKKLLDIARQLPEQQAAQTGETTTPGQPPDVEKTGEEGPPADQESAEPALTTEQVLGQAIVINGVDGALFVNREGLIAASEWTLGDDAEVYAATMAQIDRQLHQEFDKQPWGQTQTILIETGGRTFYLVCRHDGLFLFVVGGGANLGSLRMRLEGLLGRLQ